MNSLDISKEISRIHNDDVPIVFAYNHRIRPLLEKMRHLQIMEEGIQLPRTTIVLVGDQSAGKSSIMESLTGISLPRGEGGVTRVPLIIRFQNDETLPCSQLFLEYFEKLLPTNVSKVAGDIALATEEIAGEGKHISSTPLTLIVKKKGLPDLTMIDLPGITRAPVCNQLDIYELIMEYMTNKDCIILNVLSAADTDSLSAWESIAMSRRVDWMGINTLAVVTQADKYPKGLFQRVINFDCVCAINRQGDESFVEARVRELILFMNHPLLSIIDNSTVGVPVLAQRLMKIQASIIVQHINANATVTAKVHELVKLPKHMPSSGQDTLKSLMIILLSAGSSLRKILIDEKFDEYINADDMHATSRISEMLEKYSQKLQSAGNDSNSKFLIGEIKVLEETKRGIMFLDLIPGSALPSLLNSKVNGVSAILFECVEKTWSYIEHVVVSVLSRHCEICPELMSCTVRAAKNCVAMMKKKSVDGVKGLVELEKSYQYTCNPHFLASWKELISHQDEFMKRIDNNMHSWETNPRFGEISIAHLHNNFRGQLLEQAFELKMRMTAYWEIVSSRMIDHMVLNLHFNIEKLLNKEMFEEICNEVLPKITD